MTEREMTELEKAFAGRQFDRRDPEVRRHMARVQDLVFDFNACRPSDPRRREILSQLVSGYSEYVFVESGFTCVLGKNVRFEGMAMVNFNCTFLDSNVITIGHRALIGPGCSLICTNHALVAQERLAGMFDDAPITIGGDAWLGANVTVLPGVTVGNGAVIGAGSVVTRDIPAGVVAVGNPCRPLREVTDADRLAAKPC